MVCGQPCLAAHPPSSVALTSPPIELPTAPRCYPPDAPCGRCSLAAPPLLTPTANAAACQLLPPQSEEGSTGRRGGSRTLWLQRPSLYRRLRHESTAVTGCDSPFDDGDGALADHVVAAVDEFTFGTATSRPRRGGAGASSSSSTSDDECEGGAFTSHHNAGRYALGGRRAATLEPARTPAATAPAMLASPCPLAREAGGRAKRSLGGRDPMTASDPPAGPRLGEEGEPSAGAAAATAGGRAERASGLGRLAAAASCRREGRKVVARTA